MPCSLRWALTQALPDHRLTYYENNSIHFRSSGIVKIDGPVRYSLHIAASRKTHVSVSFLDKSNIVREFSLKSFTVLLFVLTINVTVNKLILQCKITARI